jgi:hypothetical protein
MRDTNYNSAETLEDVWSLYQETFINGVAPTTEHRNNALIECAKDSESISELGVNQGSSFIMLMMQNPKKIVGVDVTLKKWRGGNKKEDLKALEPLALEYMRRNPMEYIMYEGSSTDKKSVHKVDMLHIDSLHYPSHLTRELQMHADSVNKYIAFHDIKQNGYALWKVIERFLNDNPQWKLKTFYDEGKCGHVEIERV